MSFTEWKEQGEMDKPNVGPGTTTGVVGFAVLMLCFCAALIMLTVKLGLVLFS